MVVGFLQLQAERKNLTTATPMAKVFAILYCLQAGIFPTGIDCLDQCAANCSSIFHSTATIFPDTAISFVGWPSPV